MDLSALFGGSGGLNPLSLLESIFQQVVNQLAREENFAGGDRPPEELIASALGQRIARMIMEDQSPQAIRGRHLAPVFADDGLDDDDPAYDEELADRNLSLAAALGACDCWGQEDGCPVCDGIGGPGWLPPDRQLFAAYVYPAMRAVQRAGGPPHGARNNNHQQEESGHVRHAR